MSGEMDGAPVGAAADPGGATRDHAAVGPAIRRGVSPLAIPGWLMAGMRDFIRSPGPSLMVGGACVVLSWLLTAAIMLTEYGVLILPLTAGFMFAAPLLAIGLYEASRRHETGEEVRFDATRAAWRRNRFGIAFMAVLMMMFLYGWLRVATMLFALFFAGDLPPLGNFLQTAFFTPEHRNVALLGTAIGAVLAAIVFGLTAFSLPLLVDRQVDPVTAAATSMRACTANPITAALWAGVIVALTVIAAIPAFLGFAVVLPVLGHATWHAYRAMVVAPGEG
jgi:uncharacterized membrane protein